MNIDFYIKKWIKKASLKHNNFYDYSKVELKHSEDKIIIICPIHGEFEQTPNQHLNGRRCPNCYGTIKYSNEAFIKEANKVHNNKYTYSNLVYSNNKTKIKIVCDKHGEFEQRPDTHLRGVGCPSCAKYGFQPNKPAYLYYLKITTDEIKYCIR